MNNGGIMTLLAVAPLAFAAAAAAQVPKFGPNQPPPPQGQRIEAKDGDTIVLRGGARVRIVHRSEGVVRALYNADQRWIILIVDYVDPQKGAPDGQVDGTYRFDGVDGVWPLGERWEGNAYIDDYSMYQGGMGGVGLTTNAGLVQFMSAMNTNWFADPRAVGTISYKGSGRSSSMGPQPFAQAEERAIADATRNAQARDGVSITTHSLPNGATATSSVSFGASVPGPPPSQLANAPVRVGGNIPQPKKIVDVPGVLPPQAAQAGIRGVVILEIVIDTDGSVKDARVLRSIPLLDRAAIDAAKQWRYEPTQLNGQPVPVIMTVTVAFP
jgi:TonB family protein